ncbi:MAG: hypothetical protein MRJ93_07130 [Nitrososphaeraceae archaeon]|nr:hypothetical protein [Nitrososphaeraceae archaeon]
MLGYLIYEGKNRTTNSRVLNADENKIEHTFTEEGKFKDIEITMVATFWTIPVGKDVVYAEGKHIITTQNGQETATIRGFGIGRVINQSISTSYRGSFFYKTSSQDKLAFLNNMVGIFEAEVDESGNGVVKVWEWT